MKKENKESEKILELEQKIADLTNGWQRTQADFNNYRRMAAEEKLKYCQSANSDLIFELLPVLDNFQLAAKHAPENIKNDNWVIGIKQIEKQFESILNGAGLSKIATTGSQFDPKIHEAVEKIDSDKPEDEIVEETLSGYIFNGDVIRAAKVKVSRGKDSN